MIAWKHQNNKKKGSQMLFKIKKKRLSSNKRVLTDLKNVNHFSRWCQFRVAQRLCKSRRNFGENSVERLLHLHELRNNLCALLIFVNWNFDQSPQLSSPIPRLNDSKRLLTHFAARALRCDVFFLFFVFFGPRQIAALVNVVVQVGKQSNRLFHALGTRRLAKQVQKSQILKHREKERKRGEKTGQKRLRAIKREK